MLPPTTSRCIGCSSNSRFVTIPKLPPPPRTPHSSSGFSSALACDELAVGRDDVDGAQVVERQAETPSDAAEPAAEREPGHARVRHGAGRRHQTELHRLVVHVAEQAAAGNVGDALALVDAHAAHQREIDHQALVAGRLARMAMPAALHGHEQARAAREIDGSANVGDAARLHDERRKLADRRVQHAPRVVVRGMARQQQIAAEALTELLHGGAFQRHFRAFAGHGVDVRIDGLRRTQNRAEGARSPAAKRRWRRLKNLERTCVDSSFPRVGLGADLPIIVRSTQRLSQNPSGAPPGAGVTVSVRGWE